MSYDICSMSLDICIKEHYFHSCFWSCLVPVLSGSPKPTDCFALSGPVDRAHYQHPPSWPCADSVGLCPLVRTPLGLWSPSAPGLSPVTGQHHSCCSLALLWDNWNTHHPLPLSGIDPYKGLCFPGWVPTLQACGMVSRGWPLKDTL